MDKSQQAAAQKLAEEVLHIHRHCPKDTQEEKEKCERIEKLADIARTIIADPLDYHAAQDDQTWL